MNGKGSQRRPAAVSASELETAWARTFGRAEVGTREVALPDEYWTGKPGTRVTIVVPPFNDEPPGDQ